jgi:hypothetical protein
MFLQAAEAPICNLDSSLNLQTTVVIRCHKSSQVYKFVDDFDILVVIVFPDAIMYFVIALLLLLLLVEDDARRL